VSEKLRILVLLLSGGVVLAGPFIRDDGLRVLWMMLGLASVLLCFRLLRVRLAK
jgi:hypothetical protein